MLDLGCQERMSNPCTVNVTLPSRRDPHCGSGNRMAWYSTLLNHRLPASLYCPPLTCSSPDGYHVSLTTHMPLLSQKHHPPVPFSTLQVQGHLNKYHYSENLFILSKWFSNPKALLKWPLSFDDISWVSPKNCFVILQTISSVISSQFSTTTTVDRSHRQICV